MTKDRKKPLVDFSQRVRELLTNRRLSLAELAEKAELAPSLVSKLLAESDSSRREPRLEHLFAIARALEITPGILAAGTNAADVLADWVPRSELDTESKLRADAQSEAARLRTDLSGTRSEIAALRTDVEMLSSQLASTEDAARRIQSALRSEVARSRSELASAIAERDAALEQARVNYSAWADVKSHGQQLERALRGAKQSADTAAVLALFGTFGGILLGSAATAPARSASRRR